MKSLKECLAAKKEQRQLDKADMLEELKWLENQLKEAEIEYVKEGYTLYVQISFRRLCLRAKCKHKFEYWFEEKPNDRTTVCSRESIIQILVDQLA